MIVLKSQQEIACMREAGRIVAGVLERIAKLVAPGVSTAQFDELAHEHIIKHDAIPSFKGYRGFPASVCVSVNEEVVHGIPGARRLKDGDIVSFDVGAIYDGFHGDAAVTLGVGAISAEAEALTQVTLQALKRAIAQAVPGNRLGDVSHAIEEYAEGRGYSVVREYVGHGIGREMHEDPQIPNYGPPRRGPRLKAGMTFALEPMVNVGGYLTRSMDDGWTVVTADGSLSAHFEHTIAVTDDGPVILTER